MYGLSETSGPATWEPERVRPGTVGRPIPGLELRLAADGEVEVRGGNVFRGYLDDPERTAEALGDDGWLRTGDVGTVDARGFIQITDRAKDVIKSGGEWISSVELENAIMAHPEVVEAAVIGVPDERWQERPLACVVTRPGARLTPGALRAFLEQRVAPWWVPERWSFIEEVPKTSVGKFDKKVLRARHAAGELAVAEEPVPARPAR
jgi:fatty-acyl-CoA synthase